MTDEQHTSLDGIIKSETSSLKNVVHGWGLGIVGLVICTWFSFGVVSFHLYLLVLNIKSELANQRDVQANGNILRVERPLTFQDNVQAVLRKRGEIE